MAMKMDKSKLQDVNSKLEGEVSDLTREVAKLEAANQELQKQLEEALRKLAVSSDVILENLCMYGWILPSLGQTFTVYSFWCDFLVSVFVVI